MHRTIFRFAGFFSDIRQFDAVIYCIANHMYKWIFNNIYHVSVYLCFFTFGDKIDVFTDLARQVSHQPGHFLEG